MRLLAEVDWSCAPYFPPTRALIAHPPAGVRDSSYPGDEADRTWSATNRHRDPGPTVSDSNGDTPILEPPAHWENHSCALARPPLRGPTPIQPRKSCRAGAIDGRQQPGGRSPA